MKLKVVWKKAKIPYNAIERDWHDKNERNEDVVSLSISRESSIFSHHQAYNEVRGKIGVEFFKRRTGIYDEIDSALKSERLVVMEF